MWLITWQGTPASQFPGALHVSLGRGRTVSSQPHLGRQAMIGKISRVGVSFLFFRFSFHVVEYSSINFFFFGALQKNVVCTLRVAGGGGTSGWQDLPPFSLRNRLCNVFIEVPEVQTMHHADPTTKRVWKRVWPQGSTVVLIRNAGPPISGLPSINRYCRVVPLTSPRRQRWG